MSDEQEKQPSDADAELEREIRKERKFSLTEAIGRMAGPGAMKGTSPITGLRQAEYEIENWLRSHLGGGELQIVLLRGVKESELLLKNYQNPLMVLGSYCQRILGSEYLLEEVVRQADIEWGRVFDERPHFEKAGSPADADDPYTLESVRSTLMRLLEQLAEGAG
jgi:hypothetical protein